MSEKENAPANGEDAEVKQKKARTHVPDAIGTSIPPARCQTIIKAKICKPQLFAELEALRTKLEGPKDDQALEEEIKRKSRHQPRLGGNIHVVAAATADLMTMDMITHTFTTARASPSRLADVESLHSSTTISKCATYPLFCTLPAWVGYSHEAEKALKAERVQKKAKVDAGSKKTGDEAGSKKTDPKSLTSAEKKALEASKITATKAANKVLVDSKKTDSKKADPKKTEDKKKAPAKKADVKVEVNGKAEANGDKDKKVPRDVSDLNFVTYIDNAIAKVRSNDEFKNIRVQKRFREHCSDIVVQYIERLTSMMLVASEGVMCGVACTEDAPCGQRKCDAKAPCGRACTEDTQCGRDGCGGLIKERTIHAQHVLTIVKMILVTGNCSAENLEAISKDVLEKLEKFAKVCKKQKPKVEESAEDRLAKLEKQKQNVENRLVRDKAKIEEKIKAVQAKD
jgi:hypothetical protein